MNNRRNEMTWNGENAIGEAVIYFATPDEWEGYPGGYSIDWRGDVSRKNLRAYREMKIRNGGNVPQNSEQLNYGIFVVFGPATSPADAVASLRHLADVIQATGMLVGKRSDGDYLTETCERSNKS